MKLLNRDEFLKLDHEVVYMKYSNEFRTPEGLYIYEKNICGYKNNAPVDWFYTSLIDNIHADGPQDLFEHIEAAQKDRNYEIPTTYEVGSRDGFFDKSDRFYVLSKEDLGKLLRRLIRTYREMPNENMIDPASDPTMRYELIWLKNEDKNGHNVCLPKIGLHDLLFSDPNYTDEAGE